LLRQLAIDPNGERGKARKCRCAGIMPDSDMAALDLP
jgi:hypothetical protein